MSLYTRKIGNTEVSAVGFGAMGLSVFYGRPKPDEERFKVDNHKTWGSVRCLLILRTL